MSNRDPDPAALLRQGLERFSQGDVAGAQVALTSFLAASPDHLQALSVLGAIALQSGRADEAIILDDRGRVLEGTTFNVFALVDGVLTTPRAGQGVLDGITRASVMTLARDLGLEVREADLVRTDLYNADEVFFTGTAAEITPIREVDDRTVGSGTRGPITARLQEAFFEATKGGNPRSSDWLTYVD